MQDICDFQYFPRSVWGGFLLYCCLLFGYCEDGAFGYTIQLVLYKNIRKN